MRHSANQTIDRHTYHQLGQPVPKYVKATITVDLATNRHWVVQTTTFDKPGLVYLDSCGQSIASVTTDKGRSINCEAGIDDKVLGTRVALVVPKNKKVRMTFETNPSAAGLQLVTSAQADSDLPVLYSQFEMINGRSMLILPDSPSVRFRFDITLDVPKEVRGLMGANLHKGRVVNGDRALERWIMKTPIPLYLVSINVGEFVYHAFDKRCGVWANPRIIEKAAHALRRTPQVLAGLEKLFGPYLWGMYTTIVLPQRGFPFGAMEHPCMTSMNAMLLGDEVVARGTTVHEATHSWFGNLITCASWDDFWLNEGVTSFGEWLAHREVSGTKVMLLDIAASMEELRESLADFLEKGTMQHTRLKTDLAGINPDSVFSRVPYYKGALFMWAIMKQVGEKKMLRFLREYIATYRYKAIGTEEFLRFVAKKLGQDVLDAVDADAWVYQPGLPANAPKIVSPTARKIEQLAKSGVRPPSEVSSKWSAQQWMLYLSKLTRTAQYELFETLDSEHGFALSENGMLQCEFLRAALESDGCPVETFQGEIRTYLLKYGRTLHILPFYKALCKRGHYETAQSIYDEARPGYHPIGQKAVGDLLERYKQAA